MKKLSTKYRNKLSKNKGKDRCRTYFYIQPLCARMAVLSYEFLKELCLL